MEILIRRDHSISWSLLFSLSLARSLFSLLSRVSVRRRCVVGKRVIVVNSSWLLLVPIGTQFFRWENRTPARSSNYIEKPIRKKRIILFFFFVFFRCPLLFLVFSSYILSVSTSGDWITSNEHSRQAGRKKKECLKILKKTLSDFSSVWAHAAWLSWKMHLTIIFQIHVSEHMPRRCKEVS